MTTIVPITLEHRDDWERLYKGYAEFYKVKQTQEMRDRVWNWIQDPAYDVTGFLALDDSGKPIALAHFRPFYRPLMASIGGYFDDLFVDSTARGSGAAQALFAAIAEEGKKRGWSVIRWITAEDNYRGRAVYDRVGTRTKWVTYDIPL
jgi:GNAT superfamily N-acetyltransferase